MTDVLGNVGGFAGDGALQNAISGSEPLVNLLSVILCLGQMPERVELVLLSSGDEEGDAQKS